MKDDLELQIQKALDEGEDVDRLVADLDQETQAYARALEKVDGALRALPSPEPGDAVWERLAARVEVGLDQVLDAIADPTAPPEFDDLGEGDGPAREGGGRPDRRSGAFRAGVPSTVPEERRAGGFGWVGWAASAAILLGVVGIMGVLDLGQGEPVAKAPRVIRSEVPDLSSGAPGGSEAREQPAGEAAPAAAEAAPEPEAKVRLAEGEQSAGAEEDVLRGIEAKITSRRASRTTRKKEAPVPARQVSRKRALASGSEPSTPLGAPVGKERKGKEEPGGADVARAASAGVPSEGTLARALAEVAPRVQACLGKGEGEVRVELTLEGRSGHVVRARFARGGPGAEARSCIEAAVRQVRLDPFARERHVFWHRFGTAPSP